MPTIQAHVVDVLNRRLFDGSVQVADGRIVSLTPGPVSPQAPYLLPGFVDSHIHIESTLLLPEHFARLAVAQGTVAVVTDPHEIANVLGIQGIDFMLQSASKVRFHFSFGIPSGVPCTDAFETAGARISAADVQQLLPRPEFYGLAEMMNYPGLLAGDPETCLKVSHTLAAGKVVDGHAPGLTGDDARRYVQAGISTDHELYSLPHAIERIALGQKVLIREGSAARNFDELCPLLSNEDNLGMVMFCTDDIYPDELLQGHINQLVARAVDKFGPDHLWNILHAACVAPVQHYGLPVGLLQPSQSADFILVSDLTRFQVLQTWVGGQPVFADGHECVVPLHSEPTLLTPNQFAAHPITESQLRVPSRGEDLSVIVSQEQQLLTDVLHAAPLVINGAAVPDPSRDILKIVVLNRYSPAQPAVGFIQGFGLQRGAIASTIAHDSHNIIAVGASDAALVQAINHLVHSQGGICVADGSQVHSLSLPVAGLMSPLPGAEVAQAHVRLKARAHELGCRYQAPFMTLAFMALPVIPKLKITDRGLFDVTRFQFVGQD